MPEVVFVEPCCVMSDQGQDRVSVLGILVKPCGRERAELKLC